MDTEKIFSEAGKAGMNLFDMAIYQNGQIWDHRFQPCSNCHNSYSVSKAFIMTGIGMLYDEGLIDVKKPVISYMGNLVPDDIDPLWQKVTVEHAMSHKIGFSDGFLDIDVENVLEYPTRDYLSIVFHHPLDYKPGEHYQYSDAAYYLLSRLISCVSGEKADVYLNRKLFQPLDFHEAAWSRCPQDYPMGATGLYISSHDAVKLAALYLEGGVWQGKRLLSQEWTDMAIANNYDLSTRTPSGFYGKGGMYGQIVMFNRQKNCAVAWHSFSSGEHNKMMIALVDSLIE